MGPPPVSFLPTPPLPPLAPPYRGGIGGDGDEHRAVVDEGLVGHPQAQQLVDLGLARPVTLAPPMDRLPFWGTQQDLLACLGRLPLPGPVWGRNQWSMARKTGENLCFMDIYLPSN